MQPNKISIFNSNIENINNNDLISVISLAIQKNEIKTISYLTAASLNKVYNSTNLSLLFKKIDIIHPDGIGVFFASKFLYGINGLKDRMTGSDFYPYLIDTGSNNGWKFFFFGDTIETLEELKKNCNCLNIVGSQNGFDYNNELLIKEINQCDTDILVVGIGCPKQEKWILENKNKVKARVIIAVGDGIKVFAGIKKRGSVFIQKMGLEWAYRLLLNPTKLWKRYLIGIPLFIFRVIRYKFKLLKEKSY